MLFCFGVQEFPIKTMSTGLRLSIQTFCGKPTYAYCWCWAYGGVCERKNNDYLRAFLPKLDFIWYETASTSWWDNYLFCCIVLFVFLICYFSNPYHFFCWEVPRLQDCTDWQGVIKVWYDFQTLAWMKMSLWVIGGGGGGNSNHGSTVCEALDRHSRVSAICAIKRATEVQISVGVLYFWKHIGAFVTRSIFFRKY